MDEVPLSTLAGVLIASLLMSAFFSASETSLMCLNRYRLRHLARAGHGGAIRAQKLLERPDRLIGVILLGNNFANILASSTTTLIALRLGGEAALAIATGLLTLIILVFSEVAPKTLAALNPERVAFIAAYAIGPLLKVLHPLVWCTNYLANGLIRLFGVSTGPMDAQSLTQEELRTVVNEAGALIPRRHQKMLLGILDLEKTTVDDIMVPRNEIVGIDLSEDLDDIVAQLTVSRHTRLPVFRETIDDVVGIVHVRNALRLLGEGQFSKEAFKKIVRDPYFIPVGTPLTTQLLNFQREKRRIGLVVDEYGDIQGLATLEDILEEIVGEFTTDAAAVQEIHAQTDGSYMVDGAIQLRTLNRQLPCALPTEGPKTLNGLIVEYLESIPAPGTSVRIGGYTIEIVQTTGNTVKKARLYPPSSEGRSQVA